MLRPGPRRRQPQSLFLALLLLAAAAGAAAQSKAVQANFDGAPFWDSDMVVEYQ
jgi:branched-subunit amino acid aminotransferase/4-amino-4-deoxychorismate lyase